jgi:serine/threonine protein kinase, bacterial
MRDGQSHGSPDNAHRQPSAGAPTRPPPAYRQPGQQWPQPQPYYRYPPQSTGQRWAAQPYTGPNAPAPAAPQSPGRPQPSGWAPPYGASQGPSGVPPPTFVGWGGPPGYAPYPPPSGRRRKRWIWLATAAAVAAVITVVAGLVSWLVQPTTTPATLALTELDDGVMIGYPHVPTTIDIFDEPLCPHCSLFVTSSSADIARAVDAKKIAVRYHLLNFLDNDSASHDYSSRAVAASYCVAAAKDPKMYTNFYVDLFGADFQPPMGGPADHSDADLADLARSVGATSAADCVQSGQLVSTANTRADKGLDALKQLVPEASTPRVFNGTTEVDISAPEWVSHLSSAA